MTSALVASQVLHLTTVVTPRSFLGLSRMLRQLCLLPCLSEVVPSAVHFLLGIQDWGGNELGDVHTLHGIFANDGKLREALDDSMGATLANRRRVCARVCADTSFMARDQLFNNHPCALFKRDVSVVGIDKTSGQVMLLCLPFVPFVIPGL